MARHPQAPLLGAIVSGSSPLELGWESDGAWQQIRVADDDRTYDALTVVASTILSTLDRKLARVPPGASSPILESRRDA